MNPLILFVHDCKEKWRKVRIAYMRWVKLSKSGNPPSRPYYLANYLHFISPDKKVDDNVPTTNSPESPISSEDDVKLEIDEYDHLADSNGHIDESQQDMYDETQERHEIREELSRIHPDEFSSRGVNLSSSNIERLREENGRCSNMDRLREENGRFSNMDRLREENGRCSNMDRLREDNTRCSNIEKLREENNRLQTEIEREASSKRNVNNRLETQKSIVVDENNPRRMFLLSLLPDIEMLNEQEMRTFRREVINLLDNIITTRESVIINLSNNKK